MTSTETAVADATAPQPPAASPAGVASNDPGQSSSRWSIRRRRVLAMTIWGVLFLGAWLTIGIPTDPVEAFLWIWAATIAWNNFKPWRTHLLFLRDWSLVIVLLVIYNISRGWGGSLTPHVTEMIHADTWMFGWATGGEIPTMWLQHHLYDPNHVRWYDVLASSIYFSHFVLALIVAAVLWMRNRDRWLRFVRRWFMLTALILATYFLYPAAPPWYASWESGQLPGRLMLDPSGNFYSIVRLSSRGWDALGLHHAGSLLNAAQVQESNPIAAMPSMHTAYALMIVCFFMPQVRKRWWPLMLCYPLAMTFALVYSGEHYVIDVLMGWLYVGITFAVVLAGERLWAAHKARRPARVLEPEPEPEPAVDPLAGVLLVQRATESDASIEPAVP
ncbi:MAG TPA: phosphatase PAP2 family protein [Micromonosporaceae bacterium]|jgi:hypothetical protein